MPDPLYSLEIQTDSVNITRRLDGQDFEKIKYIYIYNKSLQDWTLSKKRRYTNEETVNYEIKGELLSDFSYCKDIEQP